MIKNRQNRRAALRALKSYVRSFRPDASFLKLSELLRRDLETGKHFAEVISNHGYRPEDVALYDHAEGTAIMFPFEHF